MSEKSIEHIIESLARLESRIDRRFDSIDSRLTNFDMRLSNIENRLTNIEENVRKIAKWIPIENSDLVPDLPVRGGQRRAKQSA